MRDGHLASPCGDGVGIGRRKGAHDVGELGERGAEIGAGGAFGRHVPQRRPITKIRASPAGRFLVGIQGTSLPSTSTTSASANAGFCPGGPGH
ncbi:hypothetical protein [Kutzneria sp. NPDC052558]|uniref:hypothetical protein n=1 Tax=Kutzneria sp. NPDC052558 TaxID=3364121 RepID=UPI0037CB01BC